MSGLHTNRKIGARARFMALISYLSVLCLIPLILDEQDAYVRFHSRQGLVLWIWGVLAIFSINVPGIGGFLFSISFVFITVSSLIGIASVLLARSWRLPILGRIADTL
ncbi:MAG: hypothetical protein G8345_08110 [Magnetococcales bacterium]|nr:hypothetical protein [Magnetococcales bacterium]NGZ26838.1 hypothetical protein [Magnetococcales bacterium]